MAPFNHSNKTSCVKSHAGCSAANTATYQHYCALYYYHEWCWCQSNSQVLILIHHLTAEKTEKILSEELDV